ARELEEETGYRPGRLTRVAGGPPSAGLSNEHMDFFYAEGLTRVGAGGGDETEQIQPHVIALTDVCDWLQAREAEGVLVDPKVYAGLYFAERFAAQRTGA